MIISKKDRIMRTYRINEYITIKLENKDTFIYIDGKKFNQCKALLLTIPIPTISKYDKIDSIDELEDRLIDKLMEESSDNIENYEENETSLGIGRAEDDYFEEYMQPEGFFWGHCSNIQAWAENGYDTCLLHRNLAFPLLKELTKAGDPLAKKVFKEEIAKRFASGFRTVVTYLIKEKYIQYLDTDELNTLVENSNFKELYLIHCFSKKIPEWIFELKSLEELRISDNKLTTLSDSISKLTSLKILEIYRNKLSAIPESIGKLSSLEKLNLVGNQLSSLPESIAKLQSLKELHLHSNKFTVFPEVITKLKSLQILGFSSNRLSRLPESISDLKSLRELDLSHNKFTELPRCLMEFKGLRRVTFNSNPFSLNFGTRKLFRENDILLY